MWPDVTISLMGGPAVPHIGGELEAIHRARHIHVCENDMNVVRTSKSWIAASASLASKTVKPFSRSWSAISVLIRNSSSTTRTVAALSFVGMWDLLNFLRPPFVGSWNRDANAALAHSIHTHPKAPQIAQ